jgi:hypothetical protein
MKNSTKRTIALAGASLAVILYHMLADPTGTFTIIAFLGMMVTPIIGVWFAYLSRKALMPYVDMEQIIKDVGDNPIGKSIIFLGVCIIFYALVGLFTSQLQVANAQPVIPKNATTYISTVVVENRKYFPDSPMPFTLQDLSSTNPA